PRHLISHARRGAPMQFDTRAIVTRTLDGGRDLLPLAAADPRRYPGLLESTAQGPHARYDILFAFPGAALTLHRDGRVRDESGADRGRSFAAAVEAAWRGEQPGRFAAALGPQPASLPFRGGWLLFLAYELAAEIEPRLRLPPAPDAALPLALALRCPAAIVV